MTQINGSNFDDKKYLDTKSSFSSQNVENSTNENIFSVQDDDLNYIEKIAYENEVVRKVGIDVIMDSQMGAIGDLYQLGRKLDVITKESFVYTEKSYPNDDNPNMPDGKRLFDFINKQNYIASTVIAEGFDLDEIESNLQGYAELRDSKAQPYKVIESNLSEDAQVEAREFAIQLLEEQLQDNISSIPDYGHVREYYNDASMLDWVLTHPTSFLFDHIAEKTGMNWYETVSKDVFGQDGVFTPLNVPYYIANDKNSPIREDHATDIFGNFMRLGKIEGAISSKQNLITELKNNIDNPEKFAELYYLATDGVNFSADRIMEYKEINDEEIKQGIPKEDRQKPADVLIGRNYIGEDLAKNEMATNIAYEVNKTVGTGLMAMVPGGIVWAGLVNVGVSLLEEKTQDDPTLTKGELRKLLLQEGIGRYFMVNELGNIASEIPKTSKISTDVQNAAIAGSMKEGIDITHDVIKNATDRDGGGLISDGVEAGTGFKSILKTAFKWVVGLFTKK